VPIASLDNVAAVLLSDPPLQHATEDVVLSSHSMMNSGSESASNSHSLKASSLVQSSRHHPVRSPPTKSSPSAVPSKSPSPRVLRALSAAAAPAKNGSVVADGVNGDNKSEDETVILSDDDEDKSRLKRVVKQENGAGGEGVRSSALTSKSEPARSDPAASRRSSITNERVANKERRSNGTETKRSDIDLGPRKSPTNGKSRPVDNTSSSAPRAQSADATTTPAYDSSERLRQSLSVEPRKRKLSNGHPPSKLEPPRQRARLDSTTKSSSHHRKHAQASSPSPISPDVATHKRSSSPQSATGTIISKPRRKRHISTNSQPSEDRNKWSDDSSDESASPHSRAPPVPYLAPPRFSRSAHRILASPIRANMPHVRRADRYGTTPLAKACERGNFAQVKKAYEQAPEELDQTDNGGFAPLQKAALYGHVDVVKFLLDKGCRRDCHSKEDRDTPLIDAVENNHLDVVKLLLRSGVNPHHANKNGNRAIDSIDHEKDEAADIERELKKAMAEYQGEEEDPEDPSQQESPAVPRRQRDGPRPDLLYKELSRDNLLKYSTSGDLEAVGLFLQSVEPDNACAVAAARGGHDVVLNVLLASAKSKLETDPSPVKYDETPMLAAIGRGHLKVIKLLLDQDNFNPCRLTKDGHKYYEVAAERHGPRWQAEVELLKERYDDYRAGKVAKKKQIKLTTKQPPLSSRLDLPPPKSPKLSKIKSRPEKMDEDRRQKRLSGGKENQTKDPHRRKRLVVDDDSSQEDDSGHEAARRQSKAAMRKRANSIANKFSQPVKSKVNALPASSRSEDTKGRPGRKPKEPRLTKSHENGIAKDDIEMKDADDIPIKSELKQATPDDVRTSRKVESEAKFKAEAEDKAKKELENRARKEAEAQAKAEAEAKARAEEEARLRAEAEAKAESERLQREREKQELEQRQRQERLASMPAAIRNAMVKGPSRPLQCTRASDHGAPWMGIAQQFLPIQVFEERVIDPTCDATDLWMLSFYVVGILGLSELDLGSYPSWRKLNVSDAQRIAFLKYYNIAQLAQVYAWPQMGEKGYNHAWTTEKLGETRQQFLNMEPLWWIRLSDFEHELKSQEHLAGLKLRTSRLDYLLHKPPRKSYEAILGVRRRESTETSERTPAQTPTADDAINQNGIAAIPSAVVPNGQTTISKVS
jgi:ankyrin repeat protein